MRIWGLLTSILLLAACDGAGLGVPGATTRAQTQITVTGSGVRLGAPRGFCVDQQSSRDAIDTAFVVFGNCAAITGLKDQAQPDQSAVVTATVAVPERGTPKIADTPDHLRSFLNSDVGRRVLSRANDAATVNVVEDVVLGDVVYLRVRDVSPGAPSGTQDTYWRSYFDVRGSVVTVSVLSLDRAPLSRDDGLETLRSFTTRIVGLQRSAVAG